MRIISPEWLRARTKKHSTFAMLRSVTAHIYPASRNHGDSARREGSVGGSVRAPVGDPVRARFPDELSLHPNRLRLYFLSVVSAMEKNEPSKRVDWKTFRANPLLI